MLRNSDSGPERGLPGRISAGFQSSAGRGAGCEASQLESGRHPPRKTDFRPKRNIPRLPPPNRGSGKRQPPRREHAVPSGRPKAGRRADFEGHPTRIRPTAGPDGRDPAESRGSGERQAPRREQGVSQAATDATKGDEEIRLHTTIYPGSKYT